MSKSPIKYPANIYDQNVNRAFQQLINAINSLQDDTFNGVIREGDLKVGDFVLAGSTGAVKDAGFGIGKTGTVALVKLTVGGKNGSLTFANGLITDFTAPT